MILDIQVVAEDDIVDGLECDDGFITNDDVKMEADGSPQSSTVVYC